MIDTIDALQQHQLVILRRLRKSPLTEFELAVEIAAHSGYTPDQCEENMTAWLAELRDEGLIWSGALTNEHGQSMLAAALTNRGKELVC